MLPYKRLVFGGLLLAAVAFGAAHVQILRPVHAGAANSEPALIARATVAPKAKADPENSDAALAVTSMPSPAGEDTAEPQMTSENGRVILSWLETKNEKTATLKFAEHTSSGWTDARTVFSGDNFFINSFDVPSVRALKDGTLAAHWIENNGPDPDASKVFLSWSKDQGHTWTKPVSPHHDGTQTQHGFVSLYQAPGAGLGLVWLDGRLTNPEKETGDVSLRASVYSPDGKQLSQTIVDPRVCECCSTAAAVTSEGPIVAFRNRSAKEVRDIYVTRLAGGSWSAPAVVHQDNWIIDACPINGPAISAAGREVAVAWFSAKDDQGKAFVAFSHDAGRTFGAPVRVDDTGAQGRLGVQLLDDGSAAVIWVENVNQRSQLRLRKVTPEGVRSAATNVAETGGSRYPRITRSQGELLLSWTDTTGDSSRVQTAHANIAAK